jgi:hypothetical protein
MSKPWNEEKWQKGVAAFKQKQQTVTTKYPRMLEEELCRDERSEALEEFFAALNAAAGSDSFSWVSPFPSVEEIREANANRPVKLIMKDLDKWKKTLTFAEHFVEDYKQKIFNRQFAEAGYNSAQQQLQRQKAMEFAEKIANSKKEVVDKAVPYIREIVNVLDECLKQAEAKEAEQKVKVKRVVKEMEQLAKKSRRLHAEALRQLHNYYQKSSPNAFGKLVEIAAEHEKAKTRYCELESEISLIRLDIERPELAELPALPKKVWHEVLKAGGGKE